MCGVIIYYRCHSKTSFFFLSLLCAVGTKITKGVKHGWLQAMKLMACSELSQTLFVLKHMADLCKYLVLFFLILSQWSSEPKGLIHMHFKKPVVLLFKL